MSEVTWLWVLQVGAVILFGVAYAINYSRIIRERRKADFDAGYQAAKAEQFEENN